MKDVIVVGAGGMGRAWMDTITGREGLHLAAVVDVVLDAARRAAAERADDIRAFSSIEQALAEVPAAMVLNATIPEAHFAVSTAALRAGVPVLSEKPITPTVAEALRLTALSEATGTLIATSQSRRHSRGMRAFRDAMVERGGAEQLDVQFFQNPRFGGFRDEMDSPLLVDMAIHTFDQARYLLDADPHSVTCEEFSPSWSWYRGDAAAEAVFRFGGGARFSYSGSWCADGLPTSWNGQWRASAAGGAVSWDGERNIAAQGREGAPEPVPLPGGAEGLDAALAEFVVALDGGPAPSGEIHRNVWSLAMVEAAVASSRRDRRVEFAEVFERAHADAVAGAQGDGSDDVVATLSTWGGPVPR